MIQEISCDTCSATRVARQGVPAIVCNTPVRFCNILLDSCATPHKKQALATRIARYESENFKIGQSGERGCQASQRKGADLRRSPGNFRGISGLLFSSTVGELPGSRWGTSGEVQGLSSRSLTPFSDLPNLSSNEKCRCWASKPRKALIRPKRPFRESFCSKYVGPFSQVPLNGGVSRSGLVLPFLSFLGLPRFFWDFPDLLGDGPGIFPICPFPFSRPNKSTYKEQSRKGPRHNLDLSQKKWETPGLETPRFSLSQFSPGHVLHPARRYDCEAWVPPPDGYSPWLSIPARGANLVLGRAGSAARVCGFSGEYEDNV